MDNTTLWKIIESHFNDNPQTLVRHHIDSYNDFFKTGIYQIFKEKNPIRIYSKLDPKTNEYKSECNIYLGGKNGDKLYFGKPVINDDNNVHYMFPNEARLRNMTYGMTIHYDIDIEFVDILSPGELPILKIEEEIELNKPNINYKKSNEDVFIKGGEGEGVEYTGGAPKPTRIKPKEVLKPVYEMTTAEAEKLREALEQSKDENNVQRQWHTLEKIYLGKFPIMLQSDFCVLQGISRDVRHTMGECKNDLGGYFIIDGKEKTVVAQEKFADNMIYVREMKDDVYLYSAEIRSVSENVSKPIRTLSVKMVAPTSNLANRQLVVNIPNVRKPVPLFIVFRALGIVSDKEIISYCLLDLDKYESMVDLFVPSVYDSERILTQQNALRYIGLLTKGKTVTHALEILTDYFLPHIGETNYIPKAYALGHMVFRLLSISTGIEMATDRDNFKYKRIELVGSLLYDLFREYWSIQLREIHLGFESILYYNEARYENNLYSLITDHYLDIFRKRSLEAGFKKAFKGNWGAQTHTKRIGVVQDLNRLSFNSALNHLRKTSLPLDSSVKLVGPRVLHNSQWGFIDPIDTPDGASIGLHKHLAIATYITRGTSREPLIQWLRENWGMKFVEEFAPRILSQMSKVIVNGCWIGVIDQPIECLDKFRLYRRNALIPIYMSVSFDIAHNTIYLYTDAGRLCRPILYRDSETGRASYQSKKILKRLQDGDFTWEQLVTGFNDKRASAKFGLTNMQIYELNELYEGIQSEKNPAVLERFLKDKAIMDYIDCSESENAMIAQNTEEFEKSFVSNDLEPGTKLSKYTHCEIHESLILGMMCNLIVHPENNPASRNSFSCGQSKQAVSLYHTNYQVRMDKTALILNYGQIPLVKSRFLEHITHEENVYGENAIVAIMCYTGYNVEDAILVNEGAIKRGLFRTSYFSTYEAHEESTRNADTVIDKRFMNIEAESSIGGLKKGHDYSKLDEFGLIKEGTLVNDKTILIGLATSGAPSIVNGKEILYSDDSKTTKKGQLGVVDRVFITEGEEGQRIAKVRILEQRIPAIGDKMASRAGQKGVIGLVIPERDMPFTAEGIRPDMIINPHALPSRMTIGHLVECITGKASALLGGFSDCTAFQNEGSKIGVFGDILKQQGYHSSGNEILYNGMTGDQIESEIFIGPTYYMRLKHIVKDKINYRALGPRTALTKQPVSGRANDGGLRIGEMERDSVVSHGISDFLRESMMERGDKSYMAVCNKTGMLSVFNPSKNLFISPMADGPLKFTGSLESDNLRIEHITKFGRNFSVVCVPYSLKLLIQELQTINVQMRIITEDNIDQIENMSYSGNLDKLLKKPHTRMENLISAIKKTVEEKRTNDIITSLEESDKSASSPGYVPNSLEDFEEDITNKVESPEYAKSVSLEEEEYNGNENTNEEEEMKGGRRRMEFEGNYAKEYDYQKETDHKKEMAHQKGETVYMRGVTDGYTTRPWTITNIGDRFLTIKALDNQGLTENESTRIVSSTDIYDATQIPQAPLSSFMQPNQMLHQNSMFHQNSMPMMPTPPISVHISPKFFSGSGNDQSTTMDPLPHLANEIVPISFNPDENTSIQNYSHNNSSQNNSHHNNEENYNDDSNNNNNGAIDFSKPVIITKKG